MPEAPLELPEGIPFSFFCSLLREISQLPPKKVTSTYNQGVGASYPSLDVLKRWIAHLHRLFSPLPPGTTAIVFRMLFPEEDTNRKYDMQETRLAHQLAECFGVNEKNFQQWSSESSSGCLGDDVRLTLERICPISGSEVSPPSIAEIDALLDELASNSGFSHISIRNAYPKSTRRRQLSILKDLFRSLSPIEASILTQIILKDLRPILYPLHTTHYTSALLDFNVASVKMLIKEHAMKAWDPTGWMLKAYRVKSTFDDAAAGFELPLSQREPNIPCIGTVVQMPKSEKGKSCCHALEFFSTSERVWAETKYDGERAQVHVEILPNTKSNITIFSKSKRDSTMDRYGIHTIIRQALGLSDSQQAPKIRRNVILDAEMVACHGHHIDEFWRIHGLIEQTARGIRGGRKKPQRLFLPSPGHSQSPTATSTPESRHLALVFFDVLLVDSTSLLTMPYVQRRTILESLIITSPGESMLSERVAISMPRDKKDKQPQVLLEKIFRGIIANHQEGLVIKADEGHYHDLKMPWVKLKKDYIPGYGDALDLVVVGAGWDKARARTLRVPPSTFTVLYIGVLSNFDDLEKKPQLQPHFEIYFTVSYGLTREELEEANFLIKSSDPLPYNASNSTNPPYSFTLLPGLQPPSIILKIPLLAELFGAGFTKSPQSQHYELRFPRLTKIYRPTERHWKDAVTLQQLHEIACVAVGHEISDKHIRDWSNELWGRPISSGIKSSPKRKIMSDFWEYKLDDRATKRPKKNSPSSQRRTEVAQDSVGSSPSVSGQSHGSWTNLTLSNNQLIIPHPVKIEKLCPSSASMRQRISTDPDILQSSSGPRFSQLGVIKTSVPVLQASSLVPPCGPKHSQDHSTVLSATQFIKNSLIWLAKPSAASGQSCSPRRPWMHSIPRSQRIHSIESLLTGCGWHTDTPSNEWVERGIIFVDDTNEVGREWKSHTLKLINQRQVSLTAKHTRKPIWIFDLKTWSRSTVDIEQDALYRLE